MMNRLLFVLFLCCGFVCAQNTGFSVAHIDETAEPCVDFYQYACGAWMKKNPVPADQSRWGRFNELQERNLAILKDILETSSAKKNRTSVEQKIGDYYAACMDEGGIEKQGTAPLQPLLERVAQLENKAGIAGLLVFIHRIGAFPFFYFGSTIDYKNSSSIIAHFDQSGLTLPDRDYYLKTDAKSVETRDKYVAHIARMFELIGQSKEDAAAGAKTVMAIETELAKGSMDRVSRRNPNNRYHPMTKQEVAALAPSLGLARYLETVGAPSSEKINVGNPEFFKAVEKMVQITPLEDIRTYFKWKVIHGAAPLLPPAFVKENFDFFGRTLTGAKEMKPRWKRCVEYVDTDLGEALGQKYVEVTFGRESKARMAELIRNLETALEQDIQSLDWMTEATKKRALEKLDAIANKVGYPEKWRDYSKLEIKPGDALGNSLRSNTFELQRQFDKIGTAPDPKEWTMTPPTVNAYYSPLQNNINFPAGILQPPFFDVKLDDAVNYGGIGSVIGHELTHGFDDQGRRFDAKGNLADWWTAEDGKEFENRAACIDKQYGDYVAVGDVKLNGKLTLGENVADNGGLRIAYMALIEALEGKERKKIDGYSPEQRLFLGWAQVWCQNMTDEAARLRAQTDPHAPGRYRTNGTVSNMPEFWQAFGCKAGQPMVRGENTCRVW
jgi:endothelin-converting enzyme/putative endopeptidase